MPKTKYVAPTNQKDGLTATSRSRPRASGSRLDGKKSHNVGMKSISTTSSKREINKKPKQLLRQNLKYVAPLKLVPRLRARYSRSVGPNGILFWVLCCPNFKKQKNLCTLLQYVVRIIKQATQPSTVYNVPLTQTCLQTPRPGASASKRIQPTGPEASSASSQNSSKVTATKPDQPTAAPKEEVVDYSSYAAKALQLPADLALSSVHRRPRDVTVTKPTGPQVTRTKKYTCQIIHVKLVEKKAVPPIPFKKRKVAASGQKKEVKTKIAY